MIYIHFNRMKKYLLIRLLFIYSTVLTWCISNINLTISNSTWNLATGNNLNYNNSPYYISHDFYNMSSSWSLHILNNYKTIQQTEEYSCGCATLLSIFNYYWIDWYNEMDICKHIWTSELTGSSPDWIISFINEIWLNNFHHAAEDYFFSSPEDFEDYLIVKLDSWFVTLVDWLDYGWHWQVIIWIDTMWTDDIYDDVLIMADSLDDTDHNQDWYYITSFARFFYMREEASFTETKYKQPFITIFPK
jgi:hypothetical protein